MCPESVRLSLFAIPLAASLASLLLPAAASSPRISSPRTPAPQASAPVARNLRLAYRSPFDSEPQASRRAFYTAESDQGGTDLNGDGDALDVVVRVAPAAAGPVVGPPIAVDTFESLQMAGDRVAFTASEAAQGGSDLNGDGDASDFVVFLFDAASGQTTNTKRVKVHGGMRLTDSSLFLYLRELEEGADLNGDGDLGDYVLERIDLASGASQLVAIALDPGAQLVPPSAAGDLAVFLADEAKQGQDLNGDGKKDGKIPFVVDAASGTLRNLRFSLPDHPSLTLPAVTPVQAVFGLPEDVFGVDLNGDGDLADGVVQLLVPRTGARTNTGLALGNASLLRLDAGILAVGVSEADQGGQDLNGDGDALDDVLHLVDLTTMGTLNSGRSLRRLLGLQRGQAVFSVDEAQQGAQDLNGDGDAIDQVVHLFDLSGAPATNLGLAVPWMLSSLTQYASGRMTAIRVSEAFQGGSDLNGDGDRGDEVWFIHDRLLGVTTNTRLAWWPGSAYAYAQAGPDFVLFAVSELASGYSDLNGDGDAADVVLHLYEAGAGLVTNLGLALGGSYAGFGNLDGRRLVIGLGEAENGGIDLNGDGDTLDRVAHVVDL